MIARFNLLALLVVILTIVPARATDNPVIIPAVKSWISKGGQLELSSPRIIVDNKYSTELLPVANVLGHELQVITGSEVTVETGRNAKQGQIYLTMGNKALASEGYELNIEEGVEISALAPAGVYYGSRSLLQLMVQNPSVLPKGLISDEPQYPVRSILLDVGRKFIPFEELKDWIVSLSYFKINEVHLHLNDNSFGFEGGFRVEMKMIEGLTSTDGYYTQAQIRELQDFARLRGITVVPELDTPGHSRALTTVRPDLAHPKLGGNYLDITKEETYRFVEKILDELVPLFDAEHFHIGTDEYRLGAIKDKEEKEMLGEKFRQYINHFNQYLQAKGKTTRIWSGYEHMPGTTEPDQSVVIDMWETSDAIDKSKAGYQFINSSHFYTYIVPGAPYYGVDNKFLYEEWSPLQFSNKPEGMLSASDEGLLGAKIHVWNDKGQMGYTTNEIARLTMPTVMVLAEQVWGSKSASDYKAFTQVAKKVLPEGEDFDMIVRSRGQQSDDNVACGSVPGTTFLTRKAETDNETVWLLDQPSHFIANTSHNLNNKADNLEYPWTASFTVTRYKDIVRRWSRRPSGNEALLSSDLATLYMDYNYELRDEKTNAVTELKKGVAFVRDAYDKDALPGSTDHADIEIFDYQVPLNTKVKLTFVGYQNKTELYVDGELVDTKDIQMVCPLKILGGDHYTPSFLGIMHKAAVCDVADPTL
ncbi:beta-N-acetylhexosaminidase [Carboxylicivirga marina]|uniref:beta-N-acetylhexosaminidase n=1 Tax=Carboxylicivirga marina TaxID=2800988 RepID=UPI00259137D9|nr:glycoside hydrolase family 20 protein [uncultured Carboxylicivirga sp.]